MEWGKEGIWWKYRKIRLEGKAELFNIEKKKEANNKYSIRSPETKNVIFQKH